MKNHIVIELMGRTLVVPLSATFSFNNSSLEIFTPNFKYSLNIEDLQDIYLVDGKNATEEQKKLIEILPKKKETEGSGFKDVKDMKLDSKKQDEPEKKEKEKKEIKLVSGII